MSLVIAKIIEGKIQIESDTKISGDHVVRNKPIDGRLKSLVLAHNLAVSFAGDTELAKDAYEYFVKNANSKIEWKEYLEYLNDLSKTNQVDFILAGYSPDPFLLKVKDGNIEDLNSAWIGDQAAFSEFQRYYLSQDGSKKLSEKFTDSFHLVVKNQLNPRVGEFHVTLKTNLNDFQYEGHPVPVFQYNLYSELIIGRPKNLNFEQKGKPIHLPPGNSLEGDYSISFFTNPTQEWASLGIYFEYGKFGLFFCFGKLLESTKFNTASAQDFVNDVFNETGIELQGMLVMVDSLGFKFICPQNQS